MPRSASATGATPPTHQQDECDTKEVVRCLTTMFFRSRAEATSRKRRQAAPQLSSITNSRPPLRLTTRHSHVL